VLISQTRKPGSTFFLLFLNIFFVPASRLRWQLRRDKSATEGAKHKYRIKTGVFKAFLSGFWDLTIFAYLAWFAVHLLKGLAERALTAKYAKYTKNPGI